MNSQLASFKEWYEYRDTRERIFLFVLLWVLLYAIFELILFKPLYTHTASLKADADTATMQIEKWNQQIDALNKIASTPLYKQWMADSKMVESMEKQYESLLEPFSPQKWQAIVNAVLKVQAHILLLEVKNISGTLYMPPKEVTYRGQFHEQRLQITVAGNFFDVVDYLQQLEQALPNVHWGQFRYQVLTYPQAKAVMEFSTYYE